MAECSWVLLCDYAFLDQGGKPCLVGVFDSIYAKGVPTTHHQCALVVQLTGMPGEKVRVRVEIVRPTGGVLAQVEAPAELSSRGSAGLQLGMANLQIPDFGRYECQVYLDGVLGNSADFRVDPIPATGKPS
jgi:hypothetical protein